MNTTNFILTNRKLYSEKEAYKTFSKYLHKNNMKILADHICHKDLAESILSFTTQEGKLLLNLGNGEGLVQVKKRANVS